MLTTLMLSLVIGLLLGLFGGGGSILTVPMLIYLLHVDAKQAIATSFVAVGVASILALQPHARRGAVCWRSGFGFGAAGMIGAFAGGRLAANFPAELLLLLFGLVALVSGVLMMRRSSCDAAPSQADGSMSICPVRLPILRLLFDGVAVGALTGMVGVGGGFLIVPALTLLVGLPMAGAVGTSLLVIAMNALAGLIGLGGQIGLDPALMLPVAAGVMVGSGLGAWGAGRLSPNWSRRIFATMVMLVAVYLLSQVIGQALLSELMSLLTADRAIGKLLVALLLAGLVLNIGYWIHRLDRPRRFVAGD